MACRNCLHVKAYGGYHVVVIKAMEQKMQSYGESKLLSGIAVTVHL